MKKTPAPARDWTAYCNADGEPWAVFLHGHHHDLRTLQSIACKQEIIRAFEDKCGDAEPGWFSGNLNIGRWWIRDEAEAADDFDYPWQFCDENDRGAIPISGARFE